MEATVRFKGWTPSPRAVVVGMERDNKVFTLRFEGLPVYPGGTAYLHIDLGSAGADSIEIVDGLAEIMRNITQYEGGKNAYVEIIAKNDVVWHSDQMLIYVKPLPLVGEKIEQAYPTAFEQALAQTAADKAAAAKSAADAAATAAGIVTEEAARQDAESKRVKAETARETAEANREKAEAAREQETADVLASVTGAENSVTANEQQRILAERTRAAQEQARQSAEQARKQAEQRRETAETSRTEAERQRESTETSRQTAETTRNAAENGRAKAEKARETAESQRQQAETARADAEGKRVQAEQGRVTAEQGRVEAETKREEAMAQHAEKIAELEAEVAKKAEIDDTTISGTEAWSSQHIVDVLCPPLEESGNPVVCYPVAGSKLGVTASWEPTQEGEGTPSPDNIRPIRGRTQVMVERCGENLVDISDLAVGWATLKKTSDGFSMLKATDVISGIVSFTVTQIVKEVDVTPEFRIMSTGLKNGARIYNALASKRITPKVGDVINLTFSRKVGIDNPDGVVLYGFGLDSGYGEIGRSKADVMIVSGTTAPTAYTPYIGSTTTLTFPSTIYGADLQADGAGQETWELLTLTGEEQWNYESNAYFVGHYILNNLPIVTDGKCSHFIYHYNYGGDCIFCVGDSVYTGPQLTAKYTDVDAWKAYLAAQYAAGTPVQIAYKLATPQPFQATGGGAVKALQGINTILTDADTLTVTGRADPIHIIQQLQAASTASAQALADVERAVTDI